MIDVFFSFATQFLETYLFSVDRKDISKLSISVNTSNCFHPFESNSLSFLFWMARRHNLHSLFNLLKQKYLFSALRDTFRNNMTNYKARKKLANQKWIHRSVYPYRISEQAFGSRSSDGLYRGFRDVRLQRRLVDGRIQIFSDTMTSQNWRQYSTSFPGSFLYFYFLEVERGPWERGWPVFTSQI